MAGGDADPVGVSPDTDGRGATDGASVAELSIIVVAPAPQGAVGLGATGVFVKGRFGRLPVGVSTDAGGGAAVKSAAVAELSIIVVAPAP